MADVYSPNGGPVACPKCGCTQSPCWCEVEADFGRVVPTDIPCQYCGQLEYPCPCDEIWEPVQTENGDFYDCPW